MKNKRKYCGIEADRVRGDLCYCHVHDPEGTYQSQVAEKREMYRARRLRPRPQKPPPPDLTPGWKFGKPVKP